MEPASQHLKLIGKCFRSQGKRDGAGWQGGPHGDMLHGHSEARACLGKTPKTSVPRGSCFLRT